MASQTVCLWLPLLTVVPEWAWLPLIAEVVGGGLMTWA